MHFVWSFKSPDRTLTEQEITHIMNRITQIMCNNGWEVR